MKDKIEFSKSIVTAGVVVAALGYFVDIYDLVLFSVVRVPSLKNLGYGPKEVEQYGLLLLNVQMLGMLLGGIFWGILGDKRGRLSVLFGSILMYSVANILNGFAQDAMQYGIFRFIAGIGLAGELGAGITLVVESLPKEKRGWGTMIVATIGVMGAIVAGQMYNFLSNHGEVPDAWRTCYFFGGGLGLALFIMRISVYESGMFKQLKEMEVERGNFFKLFKTRARFSRYMKSILVGLSTWYVVGILVTFSPEFSKTFNIQGDITAGNAIMYTYAGITAGDFLAGGLSQILKSRKKAILIFLIMSTVAMTVFFNSYNFTADQFYLVMVFLGISSGFWAVIVTNAAEQFGTNLRATVATSVPNFIRGSLNLISLLYAWLAGMVGKLQSAQIVAVIVIIIPLVALYFTEETFGKDLDYVEE
ncbi:MAG: MFS transporter [Chlorobiales bacterium]|jgi:MFS transporter, putative metabolite:H+ symporter|nr:MFS transporter [Chlorobiales bacterium]